LYACTHNNVWAGLYVYLPVLPCVFPWYSAVFPFYAYFPQHILEPRHSLLNHPKGGPWGYNIYIVSSRLKSGLSHQQHQRCPPFPPLIYVQSLRSFIITVESIAASFLFCFFLFLFFIFHFFINAQYAQQPWKNNTFNMSYFLCALQVPNVVLITAMLLPFTF